MMNLIDTHCHLYVTEFDHDRDLMMLRAKEQGIAAVLLPNIDVSTIEAMFSLTETHPDMAYAMLGLHPCSVKEDYKNELDFIYSSIQDHTIIGIGEMGIDLYWDKTTLEWQKDAFITQVKWAQELDLPLSIHTREATGLCIEWIENMQDGSIKGVFHCFGGTKEEATRIMNAGMYMGIGGVVSYKNSNLISVLQDIGLSNIVLETDSPYLSPVPFRGKRNESAYIKNIAAHIATGLQMDIEEVAQITTTNAKQVFQLERILI